MRPRLAAGLVVALALVLLAAPTASLAATCPQTSVADIEDEVMCPVCKTPLGLAQEAPQADRERAFILERVERCQSKAQIKVALAGEFGDEVLALPDDEGFDLAAYLVPAIALAAGLAACTLAVVRWRRRRPVGSGATTANADVDAPDTSTQTAGHPRHPDAEARLDRDLDRYDAW